MSSVAIVAGGHDAQFAEQLRTRLLAAGHEAQIQTQLPADPSSPVILLWSAALDAAHAVDAQALIALWSENRLVAVRRDETLLPLGLRDLPSLGPEASDYEVVRAAREFPGMDTGDVGAMPSKVLQSKPDVREHESVEVQRRFSNVSIALTLVAMVGVAGASWYYFNKGNLERQSALTAALEEATKASEELKAAQAKQLDALKALERAREAEAKARAAGDTAALEKAQEAAQKAEEEAKKQAAAVKAQEEKATKAREDLKKSQDVAKQARSEPVKQETVAAAAPKAEAKAPMDPSKMSRSQRERLADEEAARKALEKAGTPPTQVAASAPSAAAPEGPAAVKGATDAETLYQQAVAMENDGNAKDAVRIYRRAARAGSGKAAKRLGEIFDRGVAGVPRDYAESLQWYETARQLGETVETAGVRGTPEPTKAASPESVAVAPVVPEAPKVEAARPAPAKSAAPVAAPESPKAAEPAPAAAPAVAPAPATSAPEPTQERHKLGWWRYLLIPVFVLTIIYWRRSRKRRKREAEASQSAAPPAAPAFMRAAPAPADAATLFVSYSHKDRARVEPIVSAIEQMGRRVWMDRTDITGQTGWAGQIVRAIRECRAVVLMASPNAYGSDQVVRELYLAMNHKKAIVPIEIEPADMPDELQYILAPFQHHRLSGGETRAVLGRALAAI